MVQRREYLEHFIVSTARLRLLLARLFMDLPCDTPLVIHVPSFHRTRNCLHISGQGPLLLGPRGGRLTLLPCPSLPTSPPFLSLRSLPLMPTSLEPTVRFLSGPLVVPWSRPMPRPLPHRATLGRHGILRVDSSSTSHSDLHLSVGSTQDTPPPLVTLTHLSRLTPPVPRRSPHSWSVYYVTGPPLFPQSHVYVFVSPLYVCRFLPRKVVVLTPAGSRRRKGKTRMGPSPWGPTCPVLTLRL